MWAEYAARMEENFRRKNLREETTWETNDGLEIKAEETKYMLMSRQSKAKS
jgi:hypothetical protein